MQFRTLVQLMRECVISEEDSGTNLLLIAVMLIWYVILRSNELGMIDTENVEIYSCSRTIRFYFQKITKTRTGSFYFVLPASITKYSLCTTTKIDKKYQCHEPISQAFEHKSREENGFYRMDLNKSKKKPKRLFQKLMNYITYQMWRRLVVTDLEVTGGNEFQEKITVKWNKFKGAQGIWRKLRQEENKMDF